MDEMIRTLPKQRSSLTGDVYNYQGFWYQPTEVIELIISAQQNFKASPRDIILSSSPKTGTTWLKALTFAIATRKKFDDSNNPLLTTMPHDCIPHLESNPQSRSASDVPLIATHIPYSSLPETVVASGCKIVYIYRDASDVIVSQYHFIPKLFSLAEDDKELFGKVYEDFCQGLSWYGPYWEHVLGYQKASLERPGKILILKYEDMKTDIYRNVKELAEFIGCPFSTKEEEEGEVEKIVKLCSFENLSSLEVNKTGRYRPGPRIEWEVANQLFFRKGEVGDWKNYFTDEMKENVDQLMKQKLLLE